MIKKNVLFARFPYKAVEHPDTVDWLIRAVKAAKEDQRIDQIHVARFDDTPITMTRNACIERAKRENVDYLLMIDSDMSPDLPGQKPFWETAFHHLYNHEGPAVIAAPYVGPPPHCNVYVFQWIALMNGNPNPDLKLEQFTREEAERLYGITEVAALPTGLMLLDMRGIEKLKPPYFYYEYTDEFESRKASTEDVTFTRDISLAGVPCYCAWDCWAGHWKAFRGDKPRTIQVENIRHQFVGAIEKNLRAKGLQAIKDQAAKALAADKEEKLGPLEGPREFQPKAS